MKATGKVTSKEDLEAIRLQDAGLRYDGEVVGIDTDGCVLQWGSDCGFYNCTETLEQWGIDNLNEEEVERLKKQGVIA